jgi:hypothetical protein
MEKCDDKPQTQALCWIIRLGGFAYCRFDLALACATATCTT